LGGAVVLTALGMYCISSTGVCYLLHRRVNYHFKLMSDHHLLHQLEHPMATHACENCRSLEKALIFRGNALV
jgi:hypothetical protein